ncbi:MAG: hypothetical protein ACTSRG_10675 [Candidatus Helarchaeota archaeon]
MDITELIQKVEEIYKNFMISDNTPDMEADLKIQLLDTISSMLAFCNLKKSPQSDNLSIMINNLKEKLLVWDPFGPWFKENKELVSGAYDLITQAKTLKFEEEVHPSNIVTLDDFNNFKSFVQKELQNLKDNIKTIKESIINIGKIKLQAKLVPKPTPKPPTKLKSVPEEPILEVVTKPQPKPVVPKPIPLDTPIPGTEPEVATKPEVKPKSVKKPVSIPKPVPITESPDTSTTTEPEQLGSALGSALSSKKAVQKADSSKLFGLFSKPVAEKIQEKPVKPATLGFKSVSPIYVSKPAPKSVPTQPIPVKPIFMKSVAPKPVPITPELGKPVSNKTIAPKPVEIIPISIESSALPQTNDPETLYHELISLQGKRYGLERNIKELKSLHQSGSMTEEEYKQKLSLKLEELKKISAKIERIREKLE